MRSTYSWLLLSSFILHPSSFVVADGGTVRLAQRQGNYQITLLTSPTPLRAGPIDLSVMVQNAENSELVTDGQVAIRVTRQGHARAALSRVATSDEATNKLFRAANLVLPERGWWDVEVSIDGPMGDAHTRFAMEAGQPLPKWQAL